MGGWKALGMVSTQCGAGSHAELRTLHRQLVRSGAITDKEFWESRQAQLVPNAPASAAAHKRSTDTAWQEAGALDQPTGVSNEMATLTASANAANKVTIQLTGAVIKVGARRRPL